MVRVPPWPFSTNPADAPDAAGALDSADEAAGAEDAAALLAAALGEATVDGAALVQLVAAAEPPAEVPPLVLPVSEQPVTASATVTIPAIANPTLRNLMNSGPLVIGRTWGSPTTRSVRQDLAQEVLGAAGLRSGEELIRWCVLDDFAVGHEQHAVPGLARETHLVGHHDHRHALPGQRGHHIEHLVDHLRVERAGRLVEQHDLRPHRQRPGDRYPLLLAAGQLGGQLVLLFGDAHPFEQRDGQFLGLVALQLPDFGRPES